MPPRPGAPVCRYWSRGTCNKGNNCDFQHPGSQTQSQNSFAALGQGGGTRARSGAFGGGADKSDPYNVSVANIKQDLSERSGDDPAGDRPIWPFSAYAPGRDAPRQLLEGSFEQSPEEMRVRFYLAQATGRPQEYIQQEEALLNNVKQRIQQILGDPEAARQYILEGANTHPNRIDQCQGNSQTFPSVAAAAPASGQRASFGAAAPAGSPFGQPSGLGVVKPAFGAASSMGQSSAFGAPSALGGGGAFGKPSALGGGGSAFGQTSSMGQSSPFGGAQKPAAFGQVSQPGVTGGFANTSGSAFGQASQPGATGGFANPSGSAFGQASQSGGSGGFANPSGPAFGQSTFGTAAAKPAFGAPSQPGAFGQTAQQGTAFGQASQPGRSAFGQPSQPSAFGGQSQTQQTGGSAFGAPSAFGAATNKPSPFAAAASSQPQTSSPFAAASNKPSPFAAPAQQQQTASPFSKPGGAFGSTLGSGSSAFGSPSTINTAQPSTSAFGAPSQLSGGFGTTPSSTQASQTQWKGRPIVRDEKGDPCMATPAPTANDPRRVAYTRIWFSEGPPSTQVKNPDALRDPEGLAASYEGELGRVLQGLYEVAMREGTFKDGVMPEIPPRREWVDFEV